MALTVGELVAFLKLDRDDFDRGVDESGGKFGKFASGLGKAAVAGAAVAGGALVGLAGKGIAEFASLERGMNEVFTLLPDISQDAMSGMTDDVRNFAREMGVLPNDVVPALYQSLSAGVPQDNVFEFLETAQQAALGGVTDLTTAVDGISSVVNAYGDQISGATEASDLMFTAVRLGKTNFEELSASLFNVIPTAAGLGVEFSDVTAAMAAMTAQGTPTSVATTQMRQLLVELSKEGTATSETFKELAGESFRDFIAGGGDVQGALQLMADEAATSGGSISDMFGSVEAGSAALSLTSKAGAEAFSNALGEMADASGATEAAYDQMDQGIGRSFDRIKAHGAVLIGELGERLAPAVAGVADFLEEHMDEMAAFAGRAFELIGQGAAWLRDTLGPIFNTIVGLVQTVAGWFQTSSGDISTSTAGLRDFIMSAWEQISGIISSATDAIVAIVGTFIKIVQGFWERFGSHLISHFMTTWNNIKQFIDGVLRVIQGIFEVFAGIFTGDWDRVWEGIKAIVSGVWSAIHAIIREVINKISAVIGATMAAISQAWSFVWNAIKTFVANIWDQIVDSVRQRIQDTIDEVRSIKDAILGFFSNAGRWLFDAGKKIVQGLIDGVKSMVNGVKDAVGNVAGTVRDFLPFSPAKEGPLSGQGSPDIAGMKIGEMIASGIGKVDLSRSMGQLMAQVPDGLNLAAVRGGDGAVVLPAPQVQFPRTMRLRVGDREFVAFLEEVAGGAIDQADRDLMSEVQAGPGAF